LAEHLELDRPVGVAPLDISFAGQYEQLGVAGVVGDSIVDLVDHLGGPLEHLVEQSAKGHQRAGEVETFVVGARLLPDCLDICFRVGRAFCTRRD
jgi:hypothetical protein